ncbi:MAG: tetratricopeptide repeat protein [Thermoflexales bacterium]|nr:tetratricopeptide repeat protein [Thermoflexales bacterium]
MGSLDQAKLNFAQGMRLQLEGDPQTAQARFDVAEELFKQAVVQEPANAQAYSGYARLLDACQRYGEAETHYLKALELDPDDGTIREAYETMQSKLEHTDQVEKDVGDSPVLSSPPGPEPAPQIVVEEQAPASSISQEVDGYWALGALKAEQGDWEGAEEAFQQALDLDSHHIEALKAYSSLLLDQQRYEQAEGYLATLMEIDVSCADDCLASRPLDTTPALLALRAALDARQEALESARSLLLQALEIEPDHIARVAMYGQILVELNLEQEAAEWLRNALDRGLEDAALHRAYAQLMARQSRYDEVEQHLKRALEIAPDDPDTLALREELDAELGAYNAAFRYMALAKVKIKQGAMDEANALFEKALEIDEDHLPTLKAFATFLEEQEKFDQAEGMWAIVADRAPEEAIAHFQDILDIRGDNSETLNRLARVYVQLDRLDEAESRLRHSLEQSPGQPETLALLARVLEKDGRRHEAEALLAGDMMLVQHDSSLCLHYAQLLAARRDYNQAKKFYRLAQDLSPEDVEIAQTCQEAQSRIAQFEQANREMALGWIEAGAGNYAEAERWYQQALSVDSEHVPTLIRYAELLEDTGRPMEASPYLARLAQLDPAAAEEHYKKRLPEMGDDVESRCAYALLLQNLGRLSEAKEQFQLALDRQPAYLPALTPFASVLLQENMVHEAETVLKRALDQDDASIEIHWQYGKLLIQRHRYDLARAHLERGRYEPRLGEEYNQMAEKLDQVRKAELAWAFALEMARQDPMGAESSFKEACAVCADFVPALVDYAEFLVERERSQEAFSYLKAAVQFDPYEERAGQLLAKVEEMQHTDGNPEAAEVA